MKPAVPSVLVINGGSSSIKFALYDAGEPSRRLLDGKIDRIGLEGTSLIVNHSNGKPQENLRLTVKDRRATVDFLLDWLQTRQVLELVNAVGHRVVHGMQHSEPERVTPELIEELRRITPFDPDHLPLEVELMEAFR